MRHKLVILIILLLLLSGLSGFLAAEPIKSKVNTFEDNSSEKIIQFQEDGETNKTHYISIPYKAVVTSSSFYVHSVYNSSGNYSSKPRIDVGNDGDAEWAFSGTGYGKFGKQDVFSTDEPYRSIFFDGKIKYIKDVKIFLPKNATVSWATMNVTGRGGGGVVINEINTLSDWVEIYNYGPNEDLSNWTWYWHDQRAYSGAYKIPSGFILKSRSFLIIDESSGTNNATCLYMGSNMMWTSSSSGGIAGEIRDDKGRGVDFFRCSGDTTNPTTPNKWGSPDVSYPVTNEVGYRKYDFDSDNGTDWAVGGSSTRAKLNPGQSGVGAGGANGPENATVNIGDNGGDPELNHTGVYNVSTFLPDFSTELNALIQAAPIAFTDEYGIDFVEIALNISTNKSGVIILSDLDIRYNLTTQVFLNPHNGNLINELNEVIPDTGEGNFSIPILIKSSSAGGIKITNISIDYFIPELTNDRLSIEGRDQRTICYADYTNYIFKVNVTNRAGISDVESVTLTLDIYGEPIKLRWSQDNSTFFKYFGPNDLISLDIPNCTSTALDAERWSLNYSVRFKWTYLSEEFKTCLVNTTNDTGSSVESEFFNVYRVENDLDLIGDLTVSGQYQGALSDGGWVRANEKITWSNLIAVYEGTTNIYPADKNFNIRITDDELNYWVNTSSSGKRFKITTISDPYTDHDNLHLITITDIPGVGTDVSNWRFMIRTDNDKPTVPSNIVCHADSPADPETMIDDDSTIYVTWDASSDGTGSGVGDYAMEFNNNLPIATKRSGDTAAGSEGTSIFYVRARDKVGNWGPVGSDSIDIDLTDLTFSQPTPESEGWQNSRTVACGILISDVGGSGVRAESIYYRYVETGSIFTGTWRKYKGAAEDNEQIYCTENITFNSDGVEKKIQWRANDVAGNDATDPNYYTLKIDSIPIMFESFSINFNDWHHTREPEITFFVNDSIPENDKCSGVDISSLMYQTSTTGPENYGAWAPISTTTTLSPESVKCTVKPKLIDGSLNYIRFNGKDNVGNELLTNDYRIKIDTEDPIFSNPRPVATTWCNSTKVQCNITITDLSSKLDIESVRYSISTNGTKNYGKWCKVNLKHLDKLTYQSVIITANVTLKEGEKNYIRWLVYDTAGNEEISKDYQIIVDVTGCTFHDPEPAPELWVNTETLLCSVIINDTSGSGIDTNSIEYATSTHGPENLGIWKSTGILKFDLTDLGDDAGNPEHIGPSLIRVQVPIKVFKEGSQNYICWRATDLAGNEHTYGGPFRVQIDVSPIRFLNPLPEPNSTQLDLEQNCKINIIDNEGGSGVEPNSIEYRYSTNGKSGYGEWISTGISQVKLSEGYRFFTFVNFEPGRGNYIQWRAKDMADNGPFQSADFNVNINSAPRPIISSPQHFKDKSYDYSSEDTIVFDGHKTTDPDAGDVLSFYWESNITGPIGYSHQFEAKLPSGIHKITLYVSDGNYHNASTFVNITVVKYQIIKDQDRDGIPDISDPDIDNDGHLNIDDAFPYNRSEWLDTDLDGIGNTEDFDDDDDGHPDEEDEYPLDAGRWEREEADKSLMSILIILVIIIIIIVIVVFAALSSKKKKEAKAKAEADAKASAPVSAVPSSVQPLPTPFTQVPAQFQIPATMAYQQTMPLPSMRPYQPPQPQPGPMVSAPTQTQIPMPPQQITPIDQYPALPPPSYQPTATQPLPQQKLIQPQMPQQYIPSYAPEQTQIPFQEPPQPQQPQPVQPIMPTQTIAVPGTVPQQPQQPLPMPQPQMFANFTCMNCGAPILDESRCPYCGWQRFY